MGKGAAVVVVVSAILIGLFSFSCYLMTTINPPPLSDAGETRPSIGNDDGRRSVHTNDTTGIPLGTTSTTMSALLTAIENNNFTNVTEIENQINVTAKGRRSIQHPSSGLQKPGLVILEVTDDDDKPRIEIVFYPKRSMRQKTRIHNRKEKDFDELKTKGREGVVDESVHKAVIKIMPNNTITLEESDVIMSAESAANVSGTEAPISADRAADDLKTKTPMSIERTPNDLLTKLLISAESAANSSATKVPISAQKTADYLEKEISKSIESAIDNFETKLAISSRSAVDHLEIKVPMSTDSTADDLGTNVPMAIESTEDGSNTKAPIFADSIADDSDTKSPTSAESAADDFDTKAPTSVESAADNLEIRVPMSTESASVESAADNLEIKVPISTDSGTDDLGTNVPMSIESAADGSNTEATILADSIADNLDTKTPTSAESAAGDFDTNAPTSVESAADNLEIKVPMSTDSAADELYTTASISAETGVDGSNINTLISTESVVDYLEIKEQSTEGAQIQNVESPSTYKAIETVTVTNDNTREDDFTETTEIPTYLPSTAENVHEASADSATELFNGEDTLTVDTTEPGVQSNDEGLVVTNSMFID